jgi:hypothetical protein
MLASLHVPRSLHSGDILWSVSLPWELIMLAPFLASRSLCSGDIVRGDVSPLGLHYVGSFTSLQEPPQWEHVAEVSLP